MEHEIKQFEIQNRNLLATNSLRGLRLSLDIGDAKITHTIFGRARVRVNWEQAKTRRKWLLTVVLTMAVATAAWQLSEYDGQLMDADTPQPFTENEQINAPAFKNEFTIPVATQPEEDASRKTTPIEIYSMISNRESVPQQPPALKGDEIMAAKPIARQSLQASEPETLATNYNVPVKRAEVQQTSRKTAIVESAGTADEIPSSMQHEEGNPENIIDLAEPLSNEIAPAFSSAGDIQTPAQVDAKP